MKTNALLKKLSKNFPKRLQEGFDHCGLQTGKLREDTNNIVLCLDFDEEVFEIMKNKNLFDKTDLIITHHPFIFGTKFKVFEFDEKKKVLCDKIDSKNIPIYSYHTNFDTGKDGMNDALANALNLQNIKQLDSVPMARGGFLTQPMEIHDFCKYAKKCLNVDYGKLINEGSKTIKSVAIIGGGGWSSYHDVQKEGYDIYISGDIPHHGRRGVIERQYNYLDLPHEIERIFMTQMKKILLDIDPSLNITIIDHEALPELI
ncbi:MAG: Nif3-like dinuclear metal center hexameric protein [Erysipelotrichaceae bacterium]|nr:Nif3-like dinuclear metal center hexameric protein [Erysipelotrichaceae bacterium]